MRSQGRDCPHFSKVMKEYQLKYNWQHCKTYGKCCHINRSYSAVWMGIILVDAKLKTLKMATPRHTLIRTRSSSGSDSSTLWSHSILPSKGLTKNEILRQNAIVLHSRATTFLHKLLHSDSGPCEGLAA